MRTSALERFLRYVVIDTRSDDSSTACPSTPGQLELGRLLVTELSALGLADATVDANGYVTATVPATAGLERRAAIGFIAHLDTSPEMSGTGVRPIVHRRYEGGDIALPDDPSAIIRAADNPDLVARTGDDIVTASGTTLLGADDKAGIASIMAAVEQLLARSADHTWPGSRLLYPRRRDRTRRRPVRRAGVPMCRGLYARRRNPWRARVRKFFR